MTWFTETANEDATEGEHVHMFLAVEVSLSSGYVRFWSGYGDMTLDGNTYTGSGTMGSVSDASEHTRLLAEKKTFRLSGVDPALVSEADIDACFGRSIKEWFGFLNSAGQLVAEPEVLWEGRIDSFSRVDSAEPYIEISAENRMALLDTANGWRWTHEHQQQFFASDDGFKLVPTTVTSQVRWGDRGVIVGHTFTGGRFIPITENGY